MATALIDGNSSGKEWTSENSKFIYIKFLSRSWWVYPQQS
jgi:hypothetical protein